MSGPDHFARDVREWFAGSSGVLTSERLQDLDANTDRRLHAAMAADQHVWIATVAYFVDVPPAGRMVLSPEHLMGAPAVGCFLCEQPWSAELADQPCVAVGMP